MKNHLFLTLFLFFSYLYQPPSYAMSYPWLGEKITIHFSLDDISEHSFTSSATADCVPGGVIYVDKDAAGANNGTSWANAYTFLQDALDLACDCVIPVQVWVADGTYYPDQGVGQTNNLRTSFFQLCNNVSVYGGFNGTESTLSQRNWITNVTSLSGDIDQTPTNNTGNAYHVVNASGTNNSAALDGFTITLGNANGTDPFNKGGGVYKENGGAKFYNNKFLANSAIAGGGMFNLGGSIDIVKCIFENNDALAAASATANNGAMTGTYKDCIFINNITGIDQGTVGCQGVTLTFDKCAFKGNSVTGASGAGGAFHAWSSNITMKNTLFSGNKANRGGAIFATFNTVIKLINVTGSGNWATANGGFVYGETNSNYLIDNSIVWNNRAGAVTTSTSSSVFHSGSTATIKYSDIANSGGSSSWNSAIGINGGNNVDVNPQFTLPVDPATAPTTSGNLSLTGFSPAINSGSNAAYDVFGDPQNDTDLANNPRVFDYSLGGIIDMGAYEFQGESACPDGPVVYVRATAAGSNDGTSWANAFTKLQDALHAAGACPGISQIWVAEGTYYPDEGIGQTNNLRTSSFQLKNNVAIYGGFDATESILSERNWITNVTTLSGDLDQFWNLTNNSYHVLIGSGTNNTAILDGFTVTNGAAYGGGANNNGGGMVNLSGSPTLRNLTFIYNYANTLGGAIHNNGSSPVILNCTFNSNSSNLVGGAINAEASSHVTLMDCDFISNVGVVNGGAIAVSASNPMIKDSRFIGNSSQEGGAIYAFNMVSTLTNCLFSGNRAINRGAALHFTTNANSTLINCVFSGNNALGNGGAILLWNTPNLNLVNTVIWNNRAAGSSVSTSASIFRDNATANFSYCHVANSGGSGGGWQSGIGIDGGNNSASDPLFILNIDPEEAPTTDGDLHLQAGSSAINSGNNSANTSTYDLDGNPRISNDVIDRGPFELYVPCTITTWYADADEDGFGDPTDSIVDCEEPVGYVLSSGDCDDTNADINPSMDEVCNGIDDDCDGLTDDADPDVTDQTTWYADGDNDSYGDTSLFVTSCTQPAGYVDTAGDCDDADPGIYPGATEICNGVDDDCDGLTDDADPGVTDQTTWYVDTDSDGYGDATLFVTSCNQPSGYVDLAEDCDDADASVNPGETEICNGVDDDCDGLVDEGMTDTDRDGICDALDNCPFAKNTDQGDNDNDGMGDACDPNDDNDSALDVDDCAPFDPTIYPGATEICGDLLDNDCDNKVDEPLLIETLMQQNILCHGDATGLISVAGDCGLPPYTYLWSNGSTSATNSNLTQGQYKVTVTDAQGLSKSSTFIIQQPPALSVTFTKTDVSCFGGNDGTAKPVVYGGVSPYTFIWSHGPTTKNISGLSQGMYTVTVTDKNGCTVDGTVTITEPPVLEITNTEVSPDPLNPGKYRVTVTVTGGTPAYLYRRCNSTGSSCQAWQSSNVLSNFNPGTYLVKVKDAKGCVDDQLVVISSGESMVVIEKPVGMDVDNVRMESIPEIEIEMEEEDVRFDFTSLYPNPGREFVRVNWDSPDVEKTDIVVQDVSGRRIMHSRHASIRGKNSAQVDMSSLKSGMYIITISQSSMRYSKVWIRTE